MRVRTRCQVLLLPLLVNAALLVACAGVSVQPIEDDVADRNARGFRYYEESPYILVYSDGGEGLTSKLVYLPDRTRKMCIRPYQVLATNKSTLKFTHGVLDQATLEGDSATVPKAVVEAAKSVALAAAKAAFDDPRQPDKGFEIPAPKLFKLVVDGKDTRLVGGAAVGADGNPVVIRVDVPEAKQ